MKTIIKNTHLVSKIIAWVQIVGGITGLGLMAYLMLNTGEINGAILLMFHIGITLFIFSIYSGKKLLLKNSRNIGVILSIINFTLQLVHFKSGGYGFSYDSGIKFLLGIGINEIKFDIGLISSDFNMAINTKSNEFEIMVNIIALLFIIILVDIWNKKEVNQE